MHVAALLSVLLLTAWAGCLGDDADKDLAPEHAVEAFSANDTLRMRPGEVVILEPQGPGWGRLTVEVSRTMHLGAFMGEPLEKDWPFGEYGPGEHSLLSLFPGFSAPDPPDSQVSWFAVGTPAGGQWLSSPYYGPITGTTDVAAAPDEPAVLVVSTTTAVPVVLFDTDTISLEIATLTPLDDVARSTWHLDADHPGDVHAVPEADVDALADAFAARGRTLTWDRSETMQPPSVIAAVAWTREEAGVRAGLREDSLQVSSTGAEGPGLFTWLEPAQSGPWTIEAIHAVTRDTQDVRLVRVIEETSAGLGDTEAGVAFVTVPFSDPGPLRSSEGD